MSKKHARGPPRTLTLEDLPKSPYGWPLRQIRIPQAHKVTKGNREVVVAVIDLGYRMHPAHQGRLWTNPRPTRGDVHGWDCHDDDASLEHVGPNADTPYYRNHHAFVVGQVIACAPECPAMIVRVGYGNRESWWKGIEYALERGAKILVLPHGYLTHGKASPIPLFYRGTDFGHPADNPRLLETLDRAADAGCIVCSGTADNRGRRVAVSSAGRDAVLAVGSTNRAGEAADICCSADYVQAAAPGGERSSRDPVDHIWSTGGDDNWVSFTGGCMASGFAGGVAALVASRFPGLSTEELKMVLRNTASGSTWNPRLGWGILDAKRAVSLRPEDLCGRLRIDPSSCVLRRRRAPLVLSVTVRNTGAFDVRRALLVAFNGNPLSAAAPRANMERPVLLRTRQTGHAIADVRGLHATEFALELAPGEHAELYLQACSLDRGGAHEACTIRVSPSPLRQA